VGESVDIDRDVRIREFTMADKELVRDFFDQMGGETMAFFNRGDGNRKTAMGFFDGGMKNTLFWLAEYEGKMVGYVFIWDMASMIPWLGIAVSEDMKGKKLGRRLMKRAADTAVSEGKGGILLTCHLANARAQALYERCGYIRMGTHTSGEALYLLRFEAK